MRRQYLGKGELADLLIQLEADQKREKGAKLRCQQAQYKQESELEERVEAFGLQVELWRRWVLLGCGFRPHQRGAWRRTRVKAKTQANLAGPSPSELEKQLAGRISLEWLLLTYFEAMLATSLDTEHWVSFYEKRVESTQRRYLNSLKALAQIRKLQLPNVQINVAEKQINTQLNGPG